MPDWFSEADQKIVVLNAQKIRAMRILDTTIAIGAAMNDQAAAKLMSLAGANDRDVFRMLAEAHFAKAKGTTR